MVNIRKRLNNIKNYLDFLWTFTEKEIKLRYKRTIFGFLWVLLTPFLQMLIVGFIFSFFIKIPDYFAFLFIGLLLWNFFSVSLSNATFSIVQERNLLQKARFPIEAVPISIVAANFFHTFISILIFIVIFAPFGKVNFPAFFIILPVLVWIFIFTLGASLLLAALNVRYRDVKFLTQTLLLLWFYATPVLYNIGLIPENFRKLFFLNPLTAIFELSRYALIGASVVDPILVFMNLLFSFFVVILGFIFFHKQKKYFVDWL